MNSAWSRKTRFLHVCRLAGLTPASHLDRLEPRQPSVDLAINRQLDGEGAAWLPRKERAQHEA